MWNFINNSRELGSYSYCSYLGYYSYCRYNQWQLKDRRIDPEAADGRFC